MATLVNAAGSDPSWTAKLEHHCLVLTRPVAMVGVLGMLIVSSITMADVLLRWLAGSGVVGLNEIVELIFGVTVAACLPYGVAARINLKLDLLEGAIVGRLAAWVEALGMALSFFFLAFLAWRLGVHANDMLADKKVTLILLWPVTPTLFGIAAILTLGALVQAIVALNSLHKAFAYRSVLAKRESSIATWAFVASVYGATALLLSYGLADFAGLSKWAAANPGIAISVACVYLWLLLMALAPLAASMGLLGFFCTAFFIGIAPAANASGSEIAGFLINSQVSVLPLFLMMGSFAAVAGIAEDMYALAHATFGRLPGGLAVSTIGGCAAFGAITGSTLATTALVGRIALPEMMARGYSPALATGSIAAGGTLGNLVPPGSGPLVLFALLTDASIGRLFIASAIPSLVAIVAYIVTALLYVKLVPGSAPKSARPEPGELRKAVKRCLPAVVLFGSVLGGLYVGVFTDTEAAAVGAFEAFLIALLRGKLQPARFFRAMGETTETTALIYPLIFAAFIFALFSDLTGVAKMMTVFVSQLDWPPLAVVSLLLLAFVVAGTFMDSYTIMIVSVPIVTGLILGMGYDILWWGVLNLYVIEIGGISPPFGLTMYVLKDMARVPIGVVFKGVTPFCIAGVAVLGILTVFPGLTLWLTSTMR